MKKLAFFALIGFAIISCENDEPIRTDTDGNTVEIYNPDAPEASVEIIDVTEDSVLYNLSSSGEGIIYYVVYDKNDSFPAPNSNLVVVRNRRVIFEESGVQELEIKRYNTSPEASSTANLDSNTEYQVYLSSINEYNVRNEEVYTFEFKTEED
ncbi:hypothetical protein GCM10009117_26790 [Gangjinia marincola]|uniref:Uncharacterized protein n=1 Tax=Gangjinia marincola TaxID=578463 RepID=A0ABN1MK04_9FLAO